MSSACVRTPRKVTRSLKAELTDHQLKCDVIIPSKEIDLEVMISPVPENTGRLDDQIDPLVPCQLPRRSDPEDPLLEIGGTPGERDVHDPVGDDLDLAAEPHAACFDLIDQLAAAGDVNSLNLPLEFVGQRRDHRGTCACTIAGGRRP